MTHPPQDFLGVAGASDYPADPEDVRPVQSLAELFVRIDDEVRRLEARVDPGGDSRLARTKVDRMALLQEMVSAIAVGHRQSTNHISLGTIGIGTQVSVIRLTAQLRNNRPH